MLLRSAWMVVWLMVSLKTQTFGPKAATLAPGHNDEGACAARPAVAVVAVAALAGTAAIPAPAIRAAAMHIAGRGSLRAVTPLVIAPPRRAASCGNLIALPLSLHLSISPPRGPSNPLAISGR